MNNTNYFQYIWSTLLSCFNYRSKSGRTEFLYFSLFFYSCSLLYSILTLFVINNLIISILLPFWGVFLLWGKLSMIALVFRRSRDIGYISLAVLYVFLILINWLQHLGTVEDNLLLFKTSICSIPIYIICIFLIIKKGKRINIKHKESIFLDKKKKRYAVGMIATMAFLLSLFLFHIIYEYTDCWVDEWIIVCSALGIFLIIIALYFILTYRNNH